ncbi:hypothetical protein D3C76_1166050 [compost metagenome]
MGAILPQDENIKFCRNAIKNGARFVRVDGLPYQRKELLKSLEYVAGKIVKTPKGRILTFRLRFILEVNPNYDPEKDTSHQGI